MSEPLIEVRDVAYSYNGSAAVRSVSFHVDAGEVVALIGSNGAGKSTTMKMVAGILRPLHGNIFLEGADISGFRCHQIVQRGVTLVPEGRRIFPRMTVLENLQLGAYVSRARHHAAQSLERVFEFFPKLVERQNQFAGSMSGGEQQMLAIARGLMSQPRILILDEPSLGLMPTMVEQLFDLVLQIRAEGLSVLLVEQNAYQTLEIADRAYVLENGHTTLEGSGAALIGNDYVRKAFLGL